jgi:anti-sigma regulatory factor (Ser/Thr protein kinase)
MPAKTQTLTGTEAMLISALAIPGHPAHVQVAREFTALVLGAHSRDDEGIAALLVSELVTNSLQHTASGQPGGTITVIVAVAPGETLIEVTDNGGAGEPVPRAPGDGDEGGRGLHLVAELSDAWGYHRREAQLTTWFQLRTPQP